MINFKFGEKVMTVALRLQSLFMETLEHLQHGSFLTWQL